MPWRVANSMASACEANSVANRSTRSCVELPCPVRMDTDAVYWPSSVRRLSGETRYLPTAMEFFIKFSMRCYRALFIRRTTASVGKTRLARVAPTIWNVVHGPTNSWREVDLKAQRTKSTSGFVCCSKKQRSRNPAKRWIGALAASEGSGQYQRNAWEPSAPDGVAGRATALTMRRAPYCTPFFELVAGGSKSSSRTC
jgi:hypothetical protein